MLNNLALVKDSETKINYLAQTGPIRFSLLEIYLFIFNIFLLTSENEGEGER